MPAVASVFFFAAGNDISCRSFCRAHANRVDANAFVERFPAAENFVGLIGLAIKNTAKCSMLS